tara:strand:+ start:1151 stop:3406 length:2256 start_codon:yes stop_codon:yes gene_type:complete
VRQVVLYIKDNDGNFQQTEMFNDETITITSKIQDAKDISKVFTDFTQTFTVPASKENNKVFNHWYNYNIDNGFDNRVKKDALLEIDYSPFKKGKVQLQSVNLKSGEPFSYTLVFYGNTINLKDLLGEDELSELTQLDNYTHDYTSSNVKTGLQSGLSSGKIIYPLISHTKRFYYDSAQSTPNYDGNLHYNTTQNSIGLAFDDLKPAIKCFTIIEAIENKYTIANGYSSNVVFTRDFFNENSGNPFKNLFLWLSRNKGPIGGDVNEDIVRSRICGSWSYVSGDLGFNISGDTWTVSTSGHTRRYDAELTITTAGANQNVPYSVKAVDYVTGNTIAQLALASGASRSMTVQLTSTFNLVNYQIKWIVESEEILSFTPSLDMTEYILNPETQTPTGTNTAIYNVGGAINTTSEIIITENVPKIKVIDFLTGLFKMFNLTAYYIEDVDDSDYGKIYVDTLDSFYADAPNNPSYGSYDISSMIDTSNTKIDAPINYIGIDFKYEKPKTLLSINHEEKFNDIFGNESVKIEGKADGEIYDVKVPFEHMKFERIIDTNKTGTSSYSSVTSPAPYITDILCGYSADGDFESKTDVTPNTGNYSPVLTKPLIFNGIQITGISSAKGIKWISDGTPSSITQYYRPSNTNESGSTSTAPSYTINFDNEIDEWNLTDYNLETNSLFKKFYSSYVNSLFDVKKRMYKVKAHLTMEVLINLRLNDRLIINNQVFIINSIKTNLKTELSELELLNVVNNYIPPYNP